MTVTMEALLVGHEDWVFSAAWQPDQDAESAAPCLLSASMDRTMMLWRPEASSGASPSQHAASYIAQSVSARHKVQKREQRKWAQQAG